MVRINKNDVVKKVSVFHEKLYTYGLWSSYVIFALSALGLWSYGTEILTKLKFGLSIYIAIFLIYNFNPYVNKAVSEFARGIAFSAGILLLLTTGAAKYMEIVKQKGLEKTGEFAKRVDAYL